MSIPASILDSHLTRVIGVAADIPCKVSWWSADHTFLGGPFWLSRSTPRTLQVLEVGGVEQKIDYEIFGRAIFWAQATAAPSFGQLFLMLDDKPKPTWMKIIGRDPSPDGVLFTFKLQYAGQQ